MYCHVTNALCPSHSESLFQSNDTHASLIMGMGIASFHWPEYPTAFHKGILLLFSISSLTCTWPYLASLVPNHWAIPWHYDIVSSLNWLDSLLCVVRNDVHHRPTLTLSLVKGCESFSWFSAPGNQLITWHWRSVHLLPGTSNIGSKTCPSMMVNMGREKHANNPASKHHCTLRRILRTIFLSYCAQQR